MIVYHSATIELCVREPVVGSHVISHALAGEISVHELADNQEVSKGFQEVAEEQ